MDGKAKATAGSCGKCAELAGEVCILKEILKANVDVVMEASASALAAGDRESMKRVLQAMACFSGVAELLNDD